MMKRKIERGLGFTRVRAWERMMWWRKKRGRWGVGFVRGNEGGRGMNKSGEEYNIVKKYEIWKKHLIHKIFNIDVWNKSVPSWSKSLSSWYMTTIRYMSALPPALVRPELDQIECK